MPLSSTVQNGQFPARSRLPGKVIPSACTIIPSIQNTSMLDCNSPAWREAPNHWPVKEDRTGRAGRRYQGHRANGNHRTSWCQNSVHAIQASITTKRKGFLSFVTRNAHFLLARREGGSCRCHGDGEHAKNDLLARLVLFDRLYFLLLIP